METSSAHTEGDCPKLRWFQYSLRTLMLFVTLCAIACSWFAVKMQQAREQRDAVEAIQALEGGVVYDYVNDAKLPYPTPPGPQWLRELLGIDFFASVVSVRLGDPQVTDASLRHLSTLTKLQALWLHNAPVTDAGLEHLKSLTRLRLLSLSGTEVTDAGLQRVERFAQLESLYLIDTAVTDSGLEHLKT